MVLYGSQQETYKALKERKVTRDRKERLETKELLVTRVLLEIKARRVRREK